MSFASPLFLLALLALPGGDRPAAPDARPPAPPRHPLHRRSDPGRRGANVGRVRRHLPLALFLAAVGVLAVALAKPERTVGVPVERASVTLVTDVSRSMKADDVDPNRLEAARKAGERFLDQAPRQLRIGSVTFSDTPQIVESPSEDRNEARSVLDGLVADGGTATGEGLQAALDSLDRERGKDGKREPAAILLLSDGESTIGRDPVGVAREAGQRGVPVFTVALGTESAVVEGPNGELLPVPPDPETLRRMSEVSGGQAFTATESDQLDKVYEKLGSTDRPEAGEARDDRRLRRRGRAAAAGRGSGAAAGGGCPGGGYPHLG